MGQLFSGITVIEVNKLNKIERVIKAKSASFDGNSLDMNDSEIFQLMTQILLIIFL